ncbi:hypothetical protein GCM10010521_43760 [Streptomyces rameus]|uniref:Uncharacterized protein n=1 Tax=Streptomyces rameus TaxID=68261 RepID=A0ABP6NLM8_9ACTN
MEVGSLFTSGDGWAQPWVLDVGLIESLRFGPPDGHTNLDVAIALTRLLYDDFVSYGTDGRDKRLNNDTVPVVVKAHRAVIERLALEPPVWPFTDHFRMSLVHSLGSWAGGRQSSAGVG